MKTDLIFPTPVWRFDNVITEDQMKSTQDFVYLVKDSDGWGRKSSNEGGWQSHDFIDPVMDINPLKDIRDAIMQRAYAAADEFGFREYTLKMTNLWFNVNNKGHFNHLHSHPGGVLSGVYYLKLPECCHGNLTFVRDFAYSHMKEYWGTANNIDRWSSEDNQTEWDVFPQLNQLVLFPAWLQHLVSASASEDERISLSFNITAFSNHYHEIYPGGQPANS